MLLVVWACSNAVALLDSASKGASYCAASPTPIRHNPARSYRLGVYGVSADKDNIMCEIHVSK